MLRPILFVGLLTHALIHLLGFLKAYNITQVNQLSLSISKAMGLAWLLACASFIITGVLYYTKIDWWWMLGLVSMAVSQTLIFMYWQDAKFGTIANTLILIAVILGYGKWQFDRSLDSELINFLPEQTVDVKIISEEETAHLPEPVQKWLKQSNIIGQRTPTSVHLHQSGQMKLKSDSEWLQVNSEQWFTINPPGFIWRANVGLGSMIQFSGKDQYTNGKGSMFIQLYSLIPIVNESGPDIDQGAAVRYLAEMMWFPSAATNEYISWEAIDSTHAKASLTYQGDTVNGIFSFNQRGEMIKFETKRYNDQTKKLETWRIEIDKNSFESFDGISVPTRASVTWVFPNEEFTWYRLEVTDLSIAY